MYRAFPPCSLMHEVHTLECGVVGKWFNFSEIDQVGPRWTPLGILLMVCNDAKILQLAQEHPIPCCCTSRRYSLRECRGLGGRRMGHVEDVAFAFVCVGFASQWPQGEVSGNKLVHLSRARLTTWALMTAFESSTGQFHILRRLRRRNRGALHTTLYLILY